MQQKNAVSTQQKNDRRASSRLSRLPFPRKLEKMKDAAGTWIERPQYHCPSDAPSLDGASYAHSIPPATLKIPIDITKQIQVLSHNVRGGKRRIGANDASRGSDSTATSGTAKCWRQ